MFHILEWLLINACNNEDYPKIWTRPHLDTLYLLMMPIDSPIAVAYSFSTFYNVLLKVYLGAGNVP